MNGAVTTFPSTCACRNIRHVPAPGSRTPTSSSPGFGDEPTAALVPAQTLSSGGQTCVWKYENVPSWKKIACARAPNQGVNLAG